jgi:diguanylate cyclase (GGDEF)-like protein
VTKTADATHFRQALLQILQAGPGEDERLLSRFESRRQPDQPYYSTLVYILTHLNFSEGEAARHWRRIRAHRDRLRFALGRDVGLRVAVLDYFLNVSRELRNPKVIELSIYQRTERDAISDGLTGLYNHAYLIQALRREVQRARRHDLKLSVVMFDLDDFKRINDSRGHLEGDRVLVKTAAIIRESVREIDIAARYGGEEFTVVLPETPRSGAQRVAERIRARLEEHFRRRRGLVTMSGGVATYPDDGANAEELLRRADEGLYRAKAAGKNRVTPGSRERRRHARTPWNLPVTVRTGAGPQAAAKGKNVSAGGVLVSVRRPMPVGTPVTLVVRPPGGAPMGLRGEVVRLEAVDGGRSAHFEVGIRLLADSTDTQALVLQRVESTARKA